MSKKNVLFLPIQFLSSLLIKDLINGSVRFVICNIFILFVFLFVFKMKGVYEIANLLLCN